jgi:hypothetical protein
LIVEEDTNVSFDYYANTSSRRLLDDEKEEIQISPIKKKNTSFFGNFFNFTN